MTVGSAVGHSAWRLFPFEVMTVGRVGRSSIGLSTFTKIRRTDFEIVG